MTRRDQDKCDRRRLKIQDLLDTVRDLAPEHYEGYLVNGGPVPAYAMDGDCEWWLSEDATRLIEELTNILEECDVED